jgi:3-isopropylmalate dehydrogenase
MATHKLLLLPGDGIGPEVMSEVKRLIDWLNSTGIAHFETEQGLVGGSAYDAHKVSIRRRHHLRGGRRAEMGQRAL